MNGVTESGRRGRLTGFADSAPGLSSAASVRAWQLLLPSLARFVLIILVIACLSWAKAVLIPMALAILFTFLLSPLLTALQRRKVPRPAAVILIVGGAGLLVSVMLWVVTSQLLALVANLPSYQDDVARRIAEFRQQGRGSTFGKLQSFIDKVTVAATQPIERIGQEEPQPVMVTSDTAPVVGPFMSGVGQMLEPLATVGLVLVLVIFMLLDRENMRNRMLRLIGEEHLMATTKALDDAAHRISRYLLAQLFLNSLFGLVVGVGLWLMDVPFALLFGALAGFLRYIPYIGPWMAAALPLALSLLTATSWHQPVLVAGLFVVLELLTNLVLETWLYGQSIGVSQSALLVAVAFWTWLWGAVGLAMAAPLTVCLVVLGKYVPILKFFDILLGDEPPLTADMKLYQRLLARDQDEAADIAREQMLERSADQVYDEVFLSALVAARRDLETDQLSDEEFARILRMLLEVMEEQGLMRVPEPVVPATDAPEKLLPQLKILACSARDAADESALLMLQSLVDPATCHLEIVGPDRLVSEVLELVETLQPSVVCIAALPPGGLAHARLFCKRLRVRFPDLKIAVGRWGIRSGLDKNREQLLASGADYVAASFRETLSQLTTLAQFPARVRNVHSPEPLPPPRTPAATSTPPAVASVNG